MPTTRPTGSTANTPWLRSLQPWPTCPIVDREVIALVVWSGLSYEEAAVALGVPVGTVRSRLSRARARLGTSVMTEDQR